MRPSEDTRRYDAAFPTTWKSRGSIGSLKLCRSTEKSTEDDRGRSSHSDFPYVCNPTKSTRVGVSTIILVDLVSSEDPVNSQPWTILHVGSRSSHRQHGGPICCLLVRARRGSEGVSCSPACIEQLAPVLPSKLVVLRLFCNDGETLRLS